MSDWPVLDLRAMRDLVAWYTMPDGTVAFALRSPEVVPGAYQPGGDGDPPTISRAIVIYQVARRRLGAASRGLVDDTEWWTWRVGVGVVPAIVTERPFDSAVAIDAATTFMQTLFGVPVREDPDLPPDAIRLELRR